MEFHRNQRVLDVYIIDALLGRGSMSVVYAAHREGSDDPVAIKVLTQSQKYPVLRRRFEREARLLKEVGRHPHIVELIDYGILESGVPCMVMEYIDGETLRQVIYEDKAIPWRRVADYTKQLCEGLASVHHRGILHRDIKPSNVMRMTEEQGEHIKLMDFGVAKPTTLDATELTTSGVLVGTPLYMSPEQLLDEPVDARSDLYALGLTMYELLSGELPFGRSMAAIQARLTKPTPKVTAPDGFPEIPEGMQVLVDGLLRMDTDDRPADTPDVLAQLSALE